MQLKITTRLSDDTTIETIYEAENLKRVVKKAGALLSFERICGMCNYTSFDLQTRDSKDKQYQFLEFVCKKCGAKRMVRFNKDGEGTYLGEWTEKYRADENKVDE